MSLTISTNTAALRAGTALAVNQTRLQKVFDRLSSGKKLTSPVDNPGGLSVSMKLSAAINRISGAQSNVQNAISFMEVQDGMLDTVGRIVDRMSELKGLSRDVMKNARDQATYNREFKDLQLQLKDMISGTFNGVSLFARYTEAKGSTETIFDIDGGQASNDHTIDVFTSADGEAGAKVSIHKALAWSALTFNSGDLTSQLEYADGIANVNAAQNAEETDAVDFTLAAQDLNSTINLSNISVGVFLAAMENVAGLRAQNGATMSRLEFQEVNIARQRSNMESALGRIRDVDMGKESAELAKYNVLRQASAAMLAQANASPEVALMLIR